MGSRKHAILAYIAGGFLGLISSIFVLYWLYFEGVMFYMAYSAITIVSFTALGVISTALIISNSQIRTLESAFRLFRLLKENSQAKSKFISFAAHELRAPLTNFKWTIKVLLDKQYGTLSKTQENLLKNAYKSTQNLEDLTNEFLDLSKLDIYKLEISLKRTSLEMLGKEIDSQTESILPLAEKKQLTLRHTQSLEKSLVLKADKGRISQVVRNLVGNAIRYTQAGGKITVALVNDKRNFIFTIRDTGIGIPQEEQPKIFSEFFRATNAKKILSSGSGIGLYICKRIIEGHGGKIWFEAEENKGSVFSFSLPLQTGSEEIEDLLKGI